MAQSSFPFENVDTTETQFSQMFRTINGGVNGTPSGTELKVTAGTGLQVSVALGQAMVRGHFYTSTAAELLTIGTANGSNPRIDSIVLTLDPTANSIVLAVVAGTPASSPVAPTLTQTDAGVYQYQLATVLVPAAAVAVSTITDTRSFMGDRFGIWSTASRPTDGKFRAGYNTTLNSPEFYNGSSWLQMATISGTETLTNKTLAAPVLTGITTAGDVYAANDFAAGKNKIINGAFDHWQRLAPGTTSFAYSTSVTQYTADRFMLYTAATTTTGTVSQQSFTPGTAPVAGYEGQYFLRVATTTISGANIHSIWQKIEDVRTFAGQTVTFSFWAKADASRVFGLRYDQIFGTGGSSEVVAAVGTFTATTSWQRFTQTFTLPSIAGKTIGPSSTLSMLFDLPQVNGSTFDLWGVQLEAGSVATPFSRAGGTLQGELAACRRYYQRYYAGTVFGFFPGIYGTSNTTNGAGTINLDTPLRTNPISLDTGGALRATLPNDTAYLFSAFSLNTAAGGPNTLCFNGVNTAATANTFYRIQASNDANAYIGVSAEL